jgi:hypothetical protein
MQVKATAMDWQSERSTAAVEAVLDYEQDPDIARILRIALSRVGNVAGRFPAGAASLYPGARGEPRKYCLESGCPPGIRTPIC